METDDPIMPPDVREANDIWCLIIKKTEGVTGSEEELFAADDIEDDVDLNKDDEINNDADEGEGEPENKNGGLVGMCQHRDAVGVACADLNAPVAGSQGWDDSSGMYHLGTPHQRVSKSWMQFHLYSSIVMSPLTCYSREV